MLNHPAALTSMGATRKLQNTGIAKVGVYGILCHNSSIRMAIVWRWGLDPGIIEDGCLQLYCDFRLRCLQE